MARVRLLGKRPLQMSQNFLKIEWVKKTRDFRIDSVGLGS